MTEPTRAPKNPAPLKISSDTAKQIMWFAVRLVISYALVAMALDRVSPWVEILVARGARNLLAFVSSPYYLKTIEWADAGYAVTTWIGPLRDGFKLPSLMFVFAFSIGYVLALPGFFSWQYWVRSLAVVLVSFFVCALAVAIVADARLTTAFLKLDIVLQPAWRSNLASVLQTNLWMLSVRLYPLMMVVALTLESGAFRSPARAASRRLRIARSCTASILLLLLAITLGFDPLVERRIRAVESESRTKHVESLEARNPKLGLGLVKLADFLLEQRNPRASLNVYRLALDHLAGPERREALEDYNRIHQKFKQDLLEQAKQRKKARERPRE